MFGNVRACIAQLRFLIDAPLAIDTVCENVTHLGGGIHVGALLKELGHHLHMALLGGQVQSIEAILWTHVHIPV